MVCSVIYLHLKPIEEMGKERGHMQTLRLISGIILLALSLVCICDTVREMALGNYGMGAPRFWAAVVFHPGCGLIALALLNGVRRGKRDAEKEGLT
jgi:hypothetical protein